MGRFPGFVPGEKQPIATLGGNIDEEPDPASGRLPGVEVEHIKDEPQNPIEQGEQ